MVHKTFIKSINIAEDEKDDCIFSLFFHGIQAVRETLKMVYSSAFSSEPFCCLLVFKEKHNA